MKLFYRLFIYLLIGIITIISVEGWLNYKIEIQQFDEDMKYNSIEIGTMMSGLIEHTWEKNGEKETIQLINDANSGKNQIKIRWVWLEKTADKAYQPVISLSKIREVLKGNIVSINVESIEGQGLRYTYFPLKLSQHRSSAIELTQSLEPLSRFSHKMLIRSLKIAILVLVISGVILYVYMSRHIRKRLVTLSEKAKKIGRGDIKPDLKIVGNDELTEFAETVNSMCRQLMDANNKISNVHEEKVKTLEQLRHNERLSTIGHISAGIAHELGTPLNIISGRSKMLTREEMSIDEIRENAEIILNQSERMTVIIRQLLDYSRQRKLRYTKASINSLVNQVFDILYPIAKKKKISLSLSDSSERHILSIDPIQIQQVLVNLVMNSIQSISDGGEVVINIFKKTISADNSVKRPFYSGISVSDTGSGINEDTMKYIFEPFFTTKKVGDGTGLGLSIIQGIIEEHRGWINVDSKEGHGTTFTFYLPMDAE